MAAATCLPVVSFVVPVRNDAVRLKRCLKSILRNDYPRDRLEVIVADNGSTDGSDAVAAVLGGRVVHVGSATVAEVRNAAARVASGRVLAFVDADHEVSQTWISSVVETLAGPGVAAAGGDCLPPADANWVQRTYDTLRRRARDQREVEWLGSGNMAVLRACFEEIGGFDPRLTSCEDVDLCTRLRRRGYRVVADPRLENRHHGDPATLGAVFAGELWRGRDNLRVSLRPPFSIRSITSAAISLVHLALVAVAVAGLFAANGPGVMVALCAAAVILGFATLRAARMLLASASRSPAQALRALAVAGAYDLGRALALVARASHRQRRAHGASAR